MIFHFPGFQAVEAYIVEGYFFASRLSQDPKSTPRILWRCIDKRIEACSINFSVIESHIPDVVAIDLNSVTL
jgi:hypothetical protein